ncbi:DUF262 domain-containing protein [Promicromonospora sp. NFX87]|uniref:DUF262 domain-containing protein n=1 Tax=Promicromonospora sp. NFX87 TaxID=3402691 RepID=UPI003AFA55FC
MSTERRQSPQAIAWFWDLYRRRLLELDPPYQRRSVWSQVYKDYFIDTILLAYPSPAVFLYEDIAEDGTTNYSVVDGKQRLTAVFEFLEGEYPVSDTASIERFRGSYFGDLPPEVKRAFYTYQFNIEFLPSSDEGTLNNIFDRINKNVARLTHQELRHARYSGMFIKGTESLAEYMEAQLQRDFPRITAQSRRQMKDVEFVAQLLLLTEGGVASQTQLELDAEYSKRDQEWENQEEVEGEFRRVIDVIQGWKESLLAGNAKRLGNQADFYSLYGAVLDLLRVRTLPDSATATARLEEFMSLVANEEARIQDKNAQRYFDAARSASNDVAQRRDRIKILTSVLLGEWRDGSS